ncbi:MAG: AAA family ATPase [Myxococcota bacterium]
MQPSNEQQVRVINPTGPLPGGLDSFERVMQEGCCWVDKSLLIQDVLSCAKHIMLITRPRRFGKTINLSLLRAFFDNAAAVAPMPDISGCFDKLLVSQHEQIMRHRGRYPVIYLSFKDVKLPTWLQAYDKIKRMLRREMTRHHELRDFVNEGLEPDEQEVWQRLLRGEGTDNDWRESLKLMCKLLCLHHKQRVWILLDEYDRPIHEAYVRSKQDGEDLQHIDSYYDQMIVFMRGFLGEALKGNDFLYRSVLTGILRVAKEDIFSGINNLGVYGVLEDQFAAHFGFTPAEVRLVLQQRDLAHRADLVQQWYDGYCFGENLPVTLYNPWSVISYLSNPTNLPKAYWVNTGGLDLLQRLTRKTKSQDREAMQTLLAGGTIEKDVSDSMPLRELEDWKSVLYSMLLNSGYVTPVSVRDGILGRFVQLRIPNTEVRKVFQRLVTNWFADVPANALLAALRQGNPQEFARQLDCFARTALSYFDIQPDEPEWVYHMLLLGILSHVVDDYRVRSNRESGDGRCDIMLIPANLNLPGVIMEFKQASTQQELEQAAQEALAQIRAKDYSAEFVDHPAKGILQLGIGFSGKHTQVRHGFIDGAELL